MMKKVDVLALQLYNNTTRKYLGQSCAMIDKHKGFEFMICFALHDDA